MAGGRTRSAALSRIAAPLRYLASVCVHVASTVSRTGQGGPNRRENSRHIWTFAGSSRPPAGTAETTCTRRIASGAELWFEKPKAPFVALSPSAGALPANDAVPCASGQAGLAAQISACMVSATVEMEGADTPMLVLMRLIRSAAQMLVFVAALAAGGIAFAGLGQPSHGRWASSSRRRRPWTTSSGSTISCSGSSSSSRSSCWSCCSS